MTPLVDALELLEVEITLELTDDRTELEDLLELEVTTTGDAMLEDEDRTLEVAEEDFIDGAEAEVAEEVLPIELEDSESLTAGVDETKDPSVDVKSSPDVSYLSAPQATSIDNMPVRARILTKRLWR